MLFSKAAALVLGAALQPVLATPALLPHQPRGNGNRNEVIRQEIDNTQLVIEYYAPRPRCNGQPAWVGVWPLDDNSSYRKKPKARVWIEPTTGDTPGTARLDMSGLGGGDGKYKVAFHCRHGRRVAWMTGQNFAIVDGHVNFWKPGSQNEIIKTYQRHDLAVVEYHAPNPPCGDERIWAGMWPADETSYERGPKAWSWARITRDQPQSLVVFPRDKVGAGEFRAAFLCNGAYRDQGPWMISDPLTVTVPPPRTENEVVSAYERSDSAVVEYYAPNPPCGDRPSYLGIWPANETSYESWPMVWGWVETTNSSESALAAFRRDKIALGEVKAAFFCNKGTVPWLESDPFEMSEVPPLEEDSCLTGGSGHWDRVPCELFLERDVCAGCRFSGSCVACYNCVTHCKRQSSPADEADEAGEAE